jgi:uncharacterized protein with von Willebrand factor type A (vWA) domain
MSGFFKKAIGLFVEFEESEDAKKNSTLSANENAAQYPASAAGSLSAQEIEKFEKHFDELFDKANLPGPDYFEFTKMMNVLEAHIHDENARISAVYASLSTQGLNKSTILDTARQYRAIVEQDKAEFEKAVHAKANEEIEGRKAELSSLEAKIKENSDMIQKLTHEITVSQQKINTLKTEMVQEEARLINNKGGYTIACQAMLNKISSDIQKLNAILQ